jgi:hypothetical protein
MALQPIRQRRDIRGIGESNPRRRAHCGLTEQANRRPAAEAWPCRMTSVLRDGSGRIQDLDALKRRIVGIP